MANTTIQYNTTHYTIQQLCALVVENEDVQPAIGEWLQFGWRAVRPQELLDEFRFAALNPGYRGDRVIRVGCVQEGVLEGYLREEGCRSEGAPRSD